MRNRILSFRLFVAVLCLSAHICLAFQKSEIVVLNAGVPGQNSREGRARFEQDVLGRHPQIVLLYFGMNDAVNEKKMLSPEEYVRNMAWMVQAARAAHVFPVLSTIQHVDTGRVLQRHTPSAYGREGPNGRIDRFNASLRTFAEKQRVDLVDFCAVLDKAGGPTPQRSPDGVHLNAGGYRLLAETFYRAIRNMLGNVRVIVAMGDSLTFGTPLQTADRTSPDTYPAALRRLVHESTGPR